MNHLEAISRVIRASEPKSEMPIGGLNSSSSKTNRTKRIKISNLEASGHAVSALKKNHDNSDSFFSSYIYLFIPLFICLFILFINLINKLHYDDKNSESTKPRNLKLGQMISLYIKLCTCNFGGTRHVLWGKCN